MKSHNVTLSPFILTAYFTYVSEWYLVRMLLLLLQHLLHFIVFSLYFLFSIVVEFKQPLLVDTKFARVLSMLFV